MKKRNLVIRGFVLLALVAAFAACASTLTSESAGEYVNDSVITNKVKTLIGTDDFFTSFEIRVDSFKGAVTLNGFINSQMAVDKAGEIVRSISGVKSINNNLVVKLTAVSLSSRMQRSGRH